MSNSADRAEWLTGHGLMVHWIAPGPFPREGERERDVNRAVDAFDVAGFLEDFDRTGAKWLIFTVGQNSGFYASPNAVLDRLAGPGRCSRRDLVLELAQALHARGKRFIAYLPCEVRGQSPEIHEAFGWTQERNTAQPEFQRRYLEFVREWAERWGRFVDGWFFDGCYTWDCLPNHLFDYPAWFDTARAGNAERLITFNDGCFCLGITEPVHPDFDYLSGETEVLSAGRVRMGREDASPLYHPAARFVAGTRCVVHALVPIDVYWAYEFATPTDPWPHRFAPFDPARPGPMPDPIYPDEELRRVFRDFTDVGGAVTFNVGIFQEGRLAPRSVAQLERLHFP